MAVEPSPTFPFNPKDWLSDDKVMTMTAPERGLYITLLAHCWLAGSLPTDMSSLKSLYGHSTGLRVKHFRTVMRCFTEKDGRLYQKRLEAERTKQLEFKELQSQKGKISAAKRATTVEPLFQPDGNPRARARSSSLVRTEEGTEASNLTGSQPKANGQPCVLPKPDARSNRPIFTGERLKVFEWMLTELRDMLGTHTNSFGLDEWFYTADRMLMQEPSIVADRWKWLKARTLDEAKRRGLPVAGQSAEDDEWNRFQALIPHAWQCKCGEIHEGTAAQAKAFTCLKNVSAAS